MMWLWLGIMESQRKKIFEMEFNKSIGEGLKRRNLMVSDFEEASIKGLKLNG